MLRPLGAPFGTGSGQQDEEALEKLSGVTEILNIHGTLNVVFAIVASTVTVDDVHRPSLTFVGKRERGILYSEVEYYSIEHVEAAHSADERYG